MSYSQNKDIISQISEYIAQQNKYFFYETIQSKLSRKYTEFIKVSDSAFVDKYGRATFLYVDLDDMQVPFYQPGTITFSSAVRNDHQESIICHNGCQQNGPILGMGCATFIAKFMGTLAINYYRMSSQKDEPSFDYEIYKISLLATLNALSPEDAQQHGRLLEMRDWLLNFSSEKITLEVYEEAFFYLKELQRINRIKDFTENEINNAKFAISSDTLKQLQSLKQQARIYNTFDKFFRQHSTQSLFHSEQFADLKKYLLSKQNIFENQDQENKELKEFLDGVKVGKKFLQSLTKHEIAQQKKPNYSLNQGSQQGSLSSLTKIPEISPNSQQQQESKIGIEEQLNVENFSIPDDFFKLRQIPKYLQKGYQEEQRVYVKRIYNFLNILSRSELVYILSQVDPTRKDMKGLLKLTSIVLEQIVIKQ